MDGCVRGVLGMLQWSRGLSTAEGLLDLVAEGLELVASMEPRSFDRGGLPRHALQAHPLFPLQWSRGLSTAEGRKSRDASNSTFELQWSRGLSTAEGPSRTGPRMTRRPLQWSRGLSTAEGPVGDGCRQLPVEVASMEPRSFDRGGRGGRQDEA